MNQPRIVTARVKQLHSLREERVKNDNFLFLPSTFPFTMPDGTNMVGKFKDEFGQETELQIVGQMAFDLNKSVDKENWNVLQVLVKTQPQIQAMLILEDPEENSNKAIKNNKLMLKVAAVIDKNEDNIDFMGKLYRRLIGPANGISPKRMYQSLTELAMNNPEVFVGSDGKMIYEEGSFETLATIDLAIEKGFFVRDMEGFIKLATGEIYAPDIQKASFRLQDDPHTMEALKFHLSGGQKVSTPGFSPQINDEDFIKLMETVGSPAEAVESISNFGIDEELKFESQLESKIPKLIELNHIEEVTIQGGHKRYVISGLPNKFKRDDLPAYFKMNRKQFEDLVSRANIDNGQEN